MPDTHGLDVLREIRARDTCIPVIVLTDMLEDDVREELQKLGISDCVQKEFSLHRLGTALRHVLEGLAETGGVVS